MVMAKIRGIITDLSLYFINYIVTYIPCWYLRKMFLMLFGVKIGSGSRILAGTQFQGLRKIRIGCHTYVNSRCHLDGRGGLTIGNNVNISNYSKIISASHDMKSGTFAYREGAVEIKDYCWLGTGAIILDRSVLEKGVVVSAGSVFKGESKQMGVYAGIPAQWIRDRGLSAEYDVIWKPFFI